MDILVAMSFDASVLFNRDMLVTTVVLGTAAMATYYYNSSYREKSSSRVVSSGVIPANPQMGHEKEYERDYERFLGSGSIFTVVPGHKKPTVVHHLADVSKFNSFEKRHSELFYYGFSASLLMDVVHFLKLSPPVIHQPVVVLSHEGVTVLGFVGSDLKGDRPDRKYTSKGIRIHWKFNRYTECMYDLFRVPKGVSRSIDLLGIA